MRHWRVLIAAAYALSCGSSDRASDPGFQIVNSEAVAIAGLALTLEVRNLSQVERVELGGQSLDVVSVTASPGDRNEVIGLLVAGDDVWFAQGNPQQAALHRFRPGSMTPDDGSFDFSTSLDAPICEDTSRDGCFEKFVMPTVNAHPAHLAMDAEGWIWVTEYFRTAISALNPVTGEFKRYPQAPSEERGHALLGAGPWELFIDDAGDVVFNSYFNNTVSWFDHTRRDDPACLALDQNDRNPCVIQLRVDEEIELAQVHSVTKGANSRVWFTTTASQQEQVPTTVGFVNADKEVIKRLSCRCLRTVGAGKTESCAIRTPPSSGLLSSSETPSGVSKKESEEQGLGRLRAKPRACT